MVSAVVMSRNHYVYSSEEEVPFTYIRHLGQGAYGTVDVVHRKPPSLGDKPLARKVFVTRKNPRERDVAAIMQEISIGIRLEHTHVVRFIQTYRTPTVYAIVMSPVADGNLDDYLHITDRNCEGILRQKELSQLSQWFGCLANALSYLHKEGVHHRDIKPQNILTKGENILLTDFGISKEFKERTISDQTETGGTKVYRALEHNEGHRPGRKADVFSLGAVFFEMLIVWSGPGELTEFVKDKNGPYCQKADKVVEWIERLRPKLHNIPWSSAMLYLCQNMLQGDKDLRPYADAIRTCWLYLPSSAVPPTPCRCFPQSEGLPGPSLRVTEEALYKATRNNDLFVRELLLENMVDVSALLLLAAENGHDAVVKLLSEKEGVDLNSQDKTGRTPLSLAAENGHDAVVRLLLENEGVNLDSKDSLGQTPLLWAAMYGKEEVVGLLLKKDGVELNARGYLGKTPLFWAAENGHLAVVQLLVGKKEIDLSSESNAGWTALQFAAKRGHEAIVEFLKRRLELAQKPKDDDREGIIVVDVENRRKL